MTVELNNIDKVKIKKELIECINFVNRTNLKPEPSELLLTSSLIPNSCLLKQLDNGRGVFFNKISLNLLFPDTVDLSFVRNNVDKETQVSKEYDIETGPSCTRSFLKKTENNYHVPLGYDEKAVKCFYLFCKVTGFFDLSIDDVNLTRIENTLTIDVLPDHAYYKGMITVLF